MMKSLKVLMVAGVMSMASAMTIMSSFSAFADWEQQTEEAWKYKDEVTGAYVTSQWIESATEKGLWYYVGADGLMATNTTTPDGYYVNEKGEWRNLNKNPDGGAAENNIPGRKTNGGYDLSGISGGYTVPEREVYVP